MIWLHSRKDDAQVSPSLNLYVQKGSIRNVPRQNHGWQVKMRSLILDCTEQSSRTCFENDLVRKDGCRGAVNSNLCLVVSKTAMFHYVLCQQQSWQMVREATSSTLVGGQNMSSSMSRLGNMVQMSLFVKRTPKL